MEAQSQSRLGQLAAWAIIAAVAAVVAVANWHDIQRSKRPTTHGALLGATAASHTSRENLDARIREMDARLVTNPDDSGAAVLLADALVRQTRVTGHASLAQRAEQVLARVLRDDPANYDANRMLATVYLSEHRFRDAIDVAAKCRTARPADPLNDGILGDAHLELGEYDEAFAAFDEMMQRRPSAAAYARVAYARELQGHLDGAVAAMQMAVDATSPADPEGLAWARTQLGDLYWQMGRRHDAKAAYAWASQAFPGHPFAVIGYAKTVAAEGDRAGALALLKNLAAESPTPDLFARIGDLLADMGRHDEADRAYALAEAAWRQDAPEPKNLARFLADHNRRVDEAVAIAERASHDRDDIFTDDALAIASFKAGRIADAKRAMARALRTGTKDASILAHAALINGV
jgi:tetratricopeptide (TPR) repeat protein